MKKLITLAIASLMVCSLAGCAAKQSTTDVHDHTHNTTQQSASAHDHSHETTQVAPETETATATQSVTESVTDSATAPATDPSAETETTPESDVSVLKKGSTKGNIYTSKTLNLTFTKPAKWAFANEHELLTYSGIEADSFGDFNATAEANPAVYDMYASYKENNSSVCICYENLQITKGDELSAKDYADMLKNAFCETPDSTVLEEGTVTFGGNKYYKLAFRSSNADTTLNRIYYLRRIDHYMTNIIVTLPENAEISSVDSMFK